MSKAKIKNYAIIGLVAVVAVGLANRYSRSSLPGNGVAAKALGA